MRMFIKTLLAVSLLTPAALLAAPSAATTSAPTPATCPCPQMGGMPQGNAPCPGMQAGMMGPGMGPHGGMRNQPAPAAGSKPAASSARPDVYGWQLMTPGERRAYQLRMLSAKNEAERAKIRAEYHKQMAERAKQQGVTLPEATPPP